MLFPSQAAQSSSLTWPEVLVIAFFLLLLFALVGGGHE